MLSITTSLPGYSRARMALISSGKGIGVTVGIVGIRVSVGSKVGSGVDVEIGMSVETGAKVAGFAPQAVEMNEKITSTDQ